jgi:uncharacterized protein (UPF0305 family)
MNFSRSSPEENQQDQDKYVKDMNSTLVARITEIRQEVVDLLVILDDMEARVSSNKKMFSEVSK